MNAEIDGLIRKFRDEDCCTLAYAIYCIEKLVVAGLVEGPQALTAGAKENIERLLALGWTPDPDQFNDAVKYLAKHGLTACKGDL